MNRSETSAQQTSGAAVLGERRMPALDGVRGIAILMVLIYHFIGYAVADIGGGGGLLIDRVFQNITGAGWTGVDLFFVLSGFLITGVLCQANASGAHYFRMFYVSRTLRIFPG